MNLKCASICGTVLHKYVAKYVVIAVSSTYTASIFTNSDRTPPCIDTYLQLFPNFENYGKNALR